MRHTGRKGWQASYKDTWSLDATLSPIILAGLIKFKQVITSDEKKHYIGVPSEHVTWEPDTYSEEIWYEALSTWLADIDKMIYAFRNIEPEYVGGWKDGSEHEDDDLETGYRLWHRIPCDEEAHAAYLKAKTEHVDMVKEGRELFAKHYDSLWW
jgi:hypothetical protein